MIFRFAAYCLTGLTTQASPLPAPATTSVRPTPAPVVEVTQTPVRRRRRPARAAYAGRPKTKKKPTKKNKKTARAKKLDPARKMLVKVQKFYEQTDDLTADFIQIYTRKALSKTYESRGTVQLKKPGMMRWDYAKPAPKHFIADGKQLFIYEPEEEQVIIDPNFQASRLSTSVSFLWGEGRLEEAFEAKLGDAKQHNVGADMTVLDLKPKSDATYHRMVMVVETRTGKVVESVLYEASGNTNHFRFKNIKTNVGVAADRFTFEPPANVEVIRRP